MLARQENTFEVEVDLGIPNVLAHLHRAARGGSAHVVDEDVEPPQTLCAGLDHAFHAGTVRHIALKRMDGLCVLPRQSQRLRQTRGVKVNRPDLSALLRQTHRHGTPIAPSWAHTPSPRDQGHFVCKSHA